MPLRAATSSSSNSISATLGSQQLQIGLIAGLIGLALVALYSLIVYRALGFVIIASLGVMAVPRVGSRLASFIGLSEVLFALGFAWLLLGETPAAIQFVGGALLLGGVILVRMDAAEADAVSVPADPILPVPTLPVPTAGEAGSGTR